MKTFVMVAITLIAGSALAGPSYKDALQWRHDFNKATSDANVPSVPGIGKRLLVLQQRAERMFGKPEEMVGDFGLVECSRSAAYFYSATQIGANQPGVLRLAFQAGNSYRNCADSIEELDKPVVKR